MMASPIFPFSQVKVCVFYVLLLCYLSCFHATFTKKNSNSSDEVALLSFKSLITHDPYGALASWGNQSYHFCKWQGVRCKKHRHLVKVIALDLQNFELSGSMSPSLVNLTLLQRLDLSENLLSGVIPKELGQLSNLQHLNLSWNHLEGMIPHTLSHCFRLQSISLMNNSFHGEIPSNLSHCSHLQIIDFRDNFFSGIIPASLGALNNLNQLLLYSNLLEAKSMSDWAFIAALANCSNLKILSLSSNRLASAFPISIGNLSSGLHLLGMKENKITGSIPTSIGRLINLQDLYVGQNLLEGALPHEIGNLYSLRNLYIGSNNLEGVLPNSIGNLSLLQFLQITENNLSGVIPPSIGQTLPNLINLFLYTNQFHGPIPSSLSNCSSIEEIDLSENDFIGKVPTNLGALRSLYRLRLYSNRLEATNSTDWIFIESLRNCTNLQILALDSNELSGILPRSIANLSTNLNILSFGENRIGGIILPEIKNLFGLSWLDFGRNQLTGIIPPTIGSLPSLQTLEFQYNDFYGEIPFTLGNLTKLYHLYLENNKLSGYIPKNLGLCNQLNILDIENNMLIGTIPYEVTSIFSAISLFLSNNLLNGSLPSNIGSLINLIELDISNNQLSGEIPNNLGQCMELKYLYMSNNNFGGNIPSSLQALRDLEDIDLSHNKLVGEIPKYLVKFSLQYLNLSFNNLEGEVPKGGIFANTSAFSMFGNKKLCGGIFELNLPACFNHSNRKGQSHLMVVVIVSSIVIFFIIFTIIVIARRKTLSKKSHFIWRLGKEKHLQISYAELLKATDGFSPENLIGAGSFGYVYKGKINREENYIVAVKVLNLQQHGALKGFEAECKALSSVRHRNLVKVLTICSSIDYKGNDFKALVFEFMCNESLEKWLHPQWNDGSNNRTCLNLIQRMNIAIDVACALDYLHNQGSKQIIHCDIKPGNVLLDEDMVAHVGDFGLAKLLVEAPTESAQTLTRSSVFKGTIGYVAPEYGMANQVSTQGDVFSFGILLLEIFTGRRPTDAIFIETHSLHHFVQMSLHNEAMKIIDPKLFSSQGDEEVGNEIQHDNNIRKHELECIISMLNIGIICSKESPLERIQIRHALKELYVIKNVFNKSVQA